MPTKLKRAQQEAGSRRVAMRSLEAKTRALCDENNRLKATIAAIHCRLSLGPKITDATVKAMIEECEFAAPTLAQLTPNKA